MNFLLNNHMWNKTLPLFFAFKHTNLLWANEEVVQSPQPVGFEKFVPFLFIFLLFYLLLIRPAQKKHKKHLLFTQALKKGDNVITSSGIVGHIHGLTDQFITLEVAENTRIKILRSQISSILDPKKK